MRHSLRILAIETSCDETAVALIDERARVLAHILYTQQEHAAWGGVVPEVAARAHAERLPLLVRRALQEANCSPQQLTHIAATAGPGLVGGLMVGVMLAKGMALALNIPFMAVNHLEGHLLSCRIDAECPFPYGVVLVSGGHSDLWIAENVARYHHLGWSIDDAAGEAFDKAARLLGLGYPGGARLEQWASKGDGNAVPALPRARERYDDCLFSFSGLKTAIAQLVAKEEKQGALSQQRRYDIAAAAQEAICDAILMRAARAMTHAKTHYGAKSFAAVGGVAANGMLRQRLAQLAEMNQLHFVAPPLALCTDNARMIANVLLEHQRVGLLKTRASDLMQEPHPRLPLVAS